MFDKLLEKLDFNKIRNTLEYIDLRYAKYLYVGKANAEQENNSWKIKIIVGLDLGTTKVCAVIAEQSETGLKSSWFWSCTIG